jgi:hypothetical protein
MRELLASTSAGAALAIDYCVYRVGLHTGMLAAALGGLDALVFTAGVGENSAVIRGRISEKLGWLGAELDGAANDSRSLLISTPKSRVALYVVPTDEEMMIARHTLARFRIVGQHCWRRRGSHDGSGCTMAAGRPRQIAQMNGPNDRPSGTARLCSRFFRHRAGWRNINRLGSLTISSPA